jgi:plastocyanin
MTLILPMIGNGYIAAGGASLVLNEFNQDSRTDTATYTLDVDAGSGGLVVMAFASQERNGSNVLDLVSVTIDGLTAAFIFNPVAVGNKAGSGIAYVDGVSSGTVTAVVTYSDIASDIIWSTYTITGALSSTPHDTDFTAGTSGTSDTVTVNVPEGGVQIATCHWSYSSAGDNITWTNVTKDWADGTLSKQVSSASDQGLTAETGRVITATASQSNYYSIVAATWS